jgi:outer membrane protein
VNHKLTAVVLGTFLILAATGAAQNAEWRLGGRAAYLSTSSTSEDLGDTGASFTLGSGAEIEFDAIVRFSEMFGAEFSIGASAPRLNVNTGESCCSTVDGGRVWIFPVTALAQIHIPIYGKWDPYAGVGVAWAIPYYDLSTDLEGAGVQELDFEGNPGVAGQVGVNYSLNNRWSANLDVRYLGTTLEARVRTDDGDFEPVTLDINPWVFGVGFQYRF